MIDLKSIKCSDCAYSFEYTHKEKDSDAEQHILFCHRYPPVFVKEVAFAQFPRVEYEGSCGEFKCL